MTLDFSIREAFISDLAGIINCINSANKSFLKKLRPKKDITSTIAIVQENKNLVLEINDTVRGWLAYQVNSDLCLLNGLYIHKDFQRKGYEKKLIEFLESEVRNKCDAIACRVLVSEPWAIIFFERAGFQTIKAENGNKKTLFPKSLQDLFNREKNKTHHAMLYKIIDSCIRGF